MNKNPDIKRKRINELDALRGIAALSVVIFHFTRGRPEGKYVFNLGWMGVDLFFIISGFVIFMTLEKCKDWKDFIVSRFSRLYPAYWLTVTFTTILIAIFIKDYYQYFRGDHSDKTSLLLKYIVNMTMFQYFFKIKEIDGPYWSLAIELTFYILMLFLFVSKSLKHILKIGFFFLCLSFIYSQTIHYVDSHFILHKMRVAFPLITYFPLFFAGILIYKIKFEGPRASLVILLLLCFIVQPFLFDNCYRNKGYVNLYEYIFVLSLFFITFVLFLTDHLKFIVNKYSLKLGEMSYSLYLLHQFVTCSVIIPFLMSHGVNFWLSSGVALIFILVLSYFVNKYIEKPGMIYIRDKYKKHKQAAASS